MKFAICTGRQVDNKHQINADKKFSFQKYFNKDKTLQL